MSRSLLGVVLAGGAGRRLGGQGGGSRCGGGGDGDAGDGIGGGGGGGGGGKACALLGGRTLLARIVETLGEVVDEVVVCARPDTELGGGLDRSVAVWREPAGAPRHPLYGLAWALAEAGGRPLLACAVDLPFLDPATLHRLAGAGGLAVLDGQPLVGRFPAAVRPALAAAARTGRPARAAVAELAPVVISVEDPARTLFNVNTPADLARAEEMLRSGG